MHYIEFVSQCFKMLCNAWNCKQTSCIGTKIGQMSGKPSARQKSNLGAQQRSGQPDGDVQHISAWFGHLQFAPNKFQDAHWIIALFLEVRLNPDFSQLSWEDLCIVFLPGFGASSTAIRPDEAIMQVIFWGLMFAHVLPPRWSRGDRNMWKHVRNIHNKIQ